MKKNNKVLVFIVALTLSSPLILVFVYNSVPTTIRIAGFTLKKLKQPTTLAFKNKFDSSEARKSNPKINSEKLKTADAIDSLKLIKETKINYNPTIDTLKFEQFISENTGERILIMGDSECGGLCKQLNDYCIQNGHKLVLSFIWNAATILNFAYADTVSKIISQYKPTYVFLVIGLNELYAKDIAKRKVAADIVANKLNGTRYTWIGPANYVSDRGINDVFISAAARGSFFSSKNLNLPKGSDNRHPSVEGYRIWMDTIASWVSTNAKYPLVMSKPIKRKQGIKSKIISLNASKFRGY